MLVAEDAVDCVVGVLLVDRSKEVVEGMPQGIGPQFSEEGEKPRIMPTANLDGNSATPLGRTVVLPRDTRLFKVLRKTEMAQVVEISVNLDGERPPVVRPERVELGAAKPPGEPLARR